MFPGLAAAVAAHRCSWATLCKLGGGRAVTRGRSQGWKNLMTFGSFTYMVPNSHPHACTMSKVKLYSTEVHKGGQGSQAPRAGKPLAPKETAENIGAELKAPLKQDPLQVRVKAVLKKREYGPKYTKNNFITGVRAINEFCLKSSDLEQLRKIRRRSPHDDTESFTVFLRSDVEAKALEVWGSLEALAREKKLRKEAEIEYRERLFRNQRILREYGDFLGNTKPRSRTLSLFLKGPGKVVMVAICINGLNCFFKFLAWIYTGSASMFSEAIHSLSDTCNQAYCILAGSLVSEGATLLVAINELRRSAQAKGTSFYKYVMESRDPSTNVILLEDTAAVLGVIIAATCMGLTSVTGNPLYDSLGSLGVGTLLGVVSAFLIYTNTEALLGRSIQPEQVQRLTELLESDPSVRAIHDVKATDLGLGKVRFKAEVDFDGRVVTRSYLEKQDFDRMMQEIQEVKTPEQLEAFMLKHGENIIDTLGAEVDRLEKELKKRNPEVRHVDLEIL
ncbi:proton-coupled zinc antiporter SLC30A9, mitochondrial isoform X4 [Chionomys nivalis]|uniref:proton-coupled zinc antiporter SLC30A9, mitochondrial isoform X4 n=1 Tax=Chionomys nivalis TaxID=269649 RepID=UPI0025979884|nr:proton-coupled zinc antiporter SLC30A9, mitochondrial isoform X4 [Chionomys nivalis]